MSPPNEALSMYTTMSCIMRMRTLWWRKYSSAVLTRLLWGDMQAHVCPQGPAGACMQVAMRGGTSPRDCLARRCCMVLLLPGRWATCSPQPCRCPVQLATARPRARWPRPTAASSTSPPEQARSQRSLAFLLYRISQHRQQVMHTWDANHIGESLSY